MFNTVKLQYIFDENANFTLVLYSLIYSLYFILSNMCDEYTTFSHTYKS